MRKFLIALTALGLAQGAWAADAALADFFGEWIGSGKAKDGATATQDRDSTVTIERAADGFKIVWSTMRTQLDDQSASVVKSTTLKFKGTGNPKVFHAMDNGDPLKGGGVAWAALKGNTLQIRSFTVEPNGSWSVQVYDRTLTAPNAMTVDFKRIADGQVARQAQLQLTKTP